MSKIILTPELLEEMDALQIYGGTTSSSLKNTDCTTQDNCSCIDNDCHCQQNKCTCTVQTNCPCFKNKCFCSSDLA